MKKIHLPTLNIETLLPSNTVFSDDGFIKDIARKYRFLSKKYNLNVPEASILLYASFHDAYCFYKNIAGMNYCRIGYKDQGRKDFNIFIRAHEEAHVLKFLGKLDLLEKAIFESHNKKIDLQSLDFEVVADIGSIYALLKQGYNPRKVMGNERGPYLLCAEQEKALELYGLRY